MIAEKVSRRVFLDFSPDESQPPAWAILQELEEPDTEADRADDRLEVLQKLFAIVLPPNMRGAEKLETAFRRFAGIVWLVKPCLFDGMSQMAIARLLGVVPQALSKVAYELSDQLGIVGVLAETQEGREAKRRAQLDRDRSAPAKKSGNAHDHHEKAVWRACESARRKIVASRPWTEEEKHRHLAAGRIGTSRNGEIRLTEAGKRAGLEIPRSKTWTRFERLALWERKYLDDDDVVTNAGREFFEAATAPAPSPGKDSLERGS